ncbi:MAG TPA: YraN family protein [Candidatus Paceibacterota bacterium]
MIRQFTSKNQRIGERGENEAVVYLVKHGFSIVGRNISNKYGEIDIVAKKKGTVYFYEVKTGLEGSWFNPGENMTEKKIRKFLVSVEFYCLVNRIKEYEAEALIVRLPVKMEEAIIEFLPLS